MHWELDKNAKTKTYWIVLGDSESGDHYGPILLSEKPADKLLKKIIHNWEYTGDKHGPGDFGTYVYLTIHEVEINELYAA